MAKPQSPPLSTQWAPAPKSWQFLVPWVHVVCQRPAQPYGNLQQQLLASAQLDMAGQQQEHQLQHTSLLQPVESTSSSSTTKEQWEETGIHPLYYPKVPVLQ